MGLCVPVEGSVPEAQFEHDGEGAFDEKGEDKQEHEGLLQGLIVQRSV